MSYELYIVNHTKQHVVNVHGNILSELELPYLNTCIGDEIRVLGQDNQWINDFFHHIYTLKEPKYDGYISIDIH